MTKVTIIVPVYNVEKYLDRCMQSLINQTLKDIEIVLVDDGSPDNCPRLCDEYANRDSRIKVVHKKNGGLGMACNSGLEVATGEYVAFCDSDDWVELYAYDEMYKAAKENNADAVYSGIQRINDQGVVTPMNQAADLEVYSGQQMVHTFMMDMVASEPGVSIERRIQMSAKTVLYSNNIIKEHGVLFVSEREYMSEDLIFNLDFLRHANSIVNLPKTYYYYYDNLSSLTSQIRTDRFDRYRILIPELLRRYKDVACFKELSLRIERLLIGYTRHDTLTYFKSTASMKQKQAFFKKIYKDSLWNDVWASYPIGKMPLKYKFFAYSQKYKCFWLAFLISKLS